MARQATDGRLIEHATDIQLRLLGVANHPGLEDAFAGEADVRYKS
jgi:hypothetical protein